MTRKQKESKQGKQYIVLRIRYGVQDKGASKKLPQICGQTVHKIRTGGHNMLSITEQVFVQESGLETY